MSDNTHDTVEVPLNAAGSDDPMTPLGYTAATAPIGSSAPVDPVVPAEVVTFAATAPVAASGPRIRWAGVIWGLAFAVVGFVALRMLLTPAGRDAVYAWTVGLTPLSIVSTVVLGIGALLVLTGLVGLAHRLQQGRSRGR